MEDFRKLMSYVLSLLSIEIPVLGYSFSILSIILSLSILSIVIGGIVKLFGGKE